MKSRLEMFTEGIERSHTENYGIYKNDKNNYMVQSKGNFYNVTTNGREVVSCTCPHFKYRQIPCKHMAKVKEEFNKDIRINHFDLLN
ncbi:MAG: SWIM zinc finger family protein [Paraclostridium sp.]